MKIRLATFAASLTALAYVALAPHSGASPDDCTLYDSRLCGDWGKVTFCPDTGSYVSVMSPCPSLITGPYAPGGLEPDDE